MKRVLILIVILIAGSSPVMAETTYQFFGSVTRYELDNGMTVLIKPMEYARSVSAQVWVRAGSLYENEHNNGLSHLLEHMAFKGTEKYTGKEINHLIEGVGGRQNAGTSNDYTNYHVTLPAPHWKRGLKVLEQMTLHPLFPPEEFNKERRVVLSELARYDDDPQKLLWKRFIPSLYENHPYERLTIGRREVLKQVTLEQLRDYYDTYYTPSRMTLVVAGSFEVPEMKELIRELFADEPSEPFDPPSFPPVSPPASERIEREERDVRQVYGVAGTTGVSVSSAHSIALDVLMQVYGGDETSRLYRNLVREQQLATSISASFWTQQETGPVVVRFRTSRENLDPLIDGIRQQTRNVAREGITKQELKRAKTQIKTDFIYSAQTPEGQANQLGYWETIHHVDYLESYLKRLESITPHQVQDLAREILVDQNWTGDVFVPEHP